MAHTFTKLLYHLVWSTKERRSVIDNDLQNDLWAYMGGIVRELDGHAICIAGMPDHTHLLVRLPQTISVADAVRTIKANSSKWVHEQSLQQRFAWQTGYSAFTVSESNRQTVERYIANQAEHHRKRSFQEEYLALLKRHGIEYDPRFVFE